MTQAVRTGPALLPFLVFRIGARNTLSFSRLYAALGDSAFNSVQSPFENPVAIPEILMCNRPFYCVVVRDSGVPALEGFTLNHVLTQRSPRSLRLKILTLDILSHRSWLPGVSEGGWIEFPRIFKHLSAVVGKWF